MHITLITISSYSSFSKLAETELINFMVIFRISGSTASTVHLYPCYRKTTWRVQWGWSLAQLWNSALCWPESWALAQCASTVPTATRRHFQCWTQLQHLEIRRRPEDDLAALETDKQWRRLLRIRIGPWESRDACDLLENRMLSSRSRLNSELIEFI